MGAFLCCYVFSLVLIASITLIYAIAKRPKRIEGQDPKSLEDQWAAHRKSVRTRAYYLGLCQVYATWRMSLDLDASITWWQGALGILITALWVLLSGGFHTQSSSRSSYWNRIDRVRATITSPNISALLFIFASILVSLTPTEPFLVAAGFGLLFTVWWQSRIRLLNPRSLKNTPLEGQMKTIAGHAGIHPPQLFEVGHSRSGHAFHGHYYQRKRRSIYLSSGLLALLDPRETQAIVASEVAALEHKSSRSLFTLLLVFVMLSAFICPVIHFLSQVPYFSIIVSLITVLISLGLVRSSRCTDDAKVTAHNNPLLEIDQRTIDLSGNVEAYISALTKIARANGKALAHSKNDELALESDPVSLKERFAAMRACTV